MACGPYYPYGEDIRFTFFEPSFFELNGFEAFVYSADRIPAFEPAAQQLGRAENIELWYQWAECKASKEDIEKAVYQFDEEIDLNERNNSFLAYLASKKEAQSYLRFAQECSPFNRSLQDPWERNADDLVDGRQERIDEAIKRMGAVQDLALKRRYAFLAIRLAYYQGEVETLTSVWEQVFAGHQTKDILYYWSLFFKTMLDPIDAQRNLQAAQVFANAPDKRFMVRFSYATNIPLEMTLDLVKNDQDRVAVLLMEGIRNQGRNLEGLKAMYRLSPDHPGLEFLLIREINKLEDWIYTPHYTEFFPATYPKGQPYPDNVNLMYQRLKDDRMYAGEVLDWISSVKSKKRAQPLLWEMSKAGLLHMTESYKKALKVIRRMEKKGIDHPEMGRWALQMKVLCLMAEGKATPASLPAPIRQKLMSDENGFSTQFLFALARTLEFKGQTSDAAIFLSMVNNENSWEDGAVFWKTKKRHQTLYADFYEDYFYYLDAQYTPEQLVAFLEEIEAAKQFQDPFKQWKYDQIKEDLPRLYDLAGTKFLRRDQLEKALFYYEKVPAWFWKEYPFPDYLDRNPFYTNLYNEKGYTAMDTVIYSKPEIIQVLLDYKKRAADPNEPQQDYYYFLVANCYLNMSFHGNSWLMRRYYWTVSDNGRSGLEDDDEYRNALKAKAYYLKAKGATKSEEFAALCLRMAGRCENYALRNEILDNEERYYVNWDQKQQQLIRSNTSYTQLQTEYPQHYEELMSNCYSFEPYFSTYDQK
jgi:hypothetical protein